jgi:hypothetical protein
MAAPATTILVFGEQDGRDSGPVCSAQPIRVDLATIKTNLKSAMESVKCMVNAMQGAVEGLSVTYVDIGIAISADGSVGILGPGSGSIPAATLTARLQSHKSLPF